MNCDVFNWVTDLEFDPVSSVFLFWPVLVEHLTVYLFPFQHFSTYDVSLEHQEMYKYAKIADSKRSDGGFDSLKPMIFFIVTPSNFEMYTEEVLKTNLDPDNTCRCMDI